MSKDVEIPYEVLNELNGSLKQIMVEFENAKNRSDALESAIGSPLGRNSLRSQANTFEDQWDDKRQTLAEDIADVQKHVQAVGEGWVNWDLEASQQLELDDNDSQNLPKAV
jgi:hypothetical protein